MEYDAERNVFDKYAFRGSGYSIEALLNAIVIVKQNDCFTIF